MLAFTSVYFLGSSLFNGLWPIGIKNFSLSRTTLKRCPSLRLDAPPSRRQIPASGNTLTGVLAFGNKVLTDVVKRRRGRRASGLSRPAFRTAHRGRSGLCSRLRLGRDANVAKRREPVLPERHDRIHTRRRSRHRGTSGGRCVAVHKKRKASFGSPGATHPMPEM